MTAGTVKHLVAADAIVHVTAVPTAPRSVVLIDQHNLAPGSHLRCLQETLAKLVMCPRQHSMGRGSVDSSPAASAGHLLCLKRGQQNNPVSVCEGCCGFLVYVVDPAVDAVPELPARRGSFPEAPCLGLCQVSACRGDACSKVLALLCSSLAASILSPSPHRRLGLVLLQRLLLWLRLLWLSWLLKLLLCTGWLSRLMLFVLLCCHLSLQFPPLPPSLSPPRTGFLLLFCPPRSH